MTNVSLSRKVAEQKSQLINMSDTQLNDLRDSVRVRFDAPLSADDRTEYSALFEAINREVFARQQLDNLADPVQAPAGLQAEIEAMDSKQLDAAVSLSRQKVYSADHIVSRSPEGRAESERLKHLAIAQQKAREAERLETEKQLQLQRDRQEAAERRRQEAGSNYVENNALEASLSEFGNG